MKIISVCAGHFGDFALARDMVIASAQSGVDAVRVPVYRTEALVEKSDPGFEKLKSFELPYVKIIELKAIAEQHGVEFVPSVFDSEGLSFAIERLGLKWVRAGSDSLLPEIAALLGSIPTLQIDLFVGGAGFKQIEGYTKSIPAKNLGLYHGVSGKPAAENEVNLARINMLCNIFPHCKIGYTDCTDDILVPSLAVLSGASVIEKNIKLTNKPCAYSSYSVKPYKLKDMVEVIRMHQEIFGEGRFHG